MQTFVTGGTGTIGSAVIAELLGNGYAVLGLARSDDSAETLATAGAEPLKGGLADLDVLRAGAAPMHPITRTPCSAWITGVPASISPAAASNATAITTVAVPGWLRVTCIDAPPELVDRYGADGWLVEIARRAMAIPDTAQRVRILVQVVAGHESFAGLCELSNGAVVRPAHLVPYLDALDVRLIIFDSATHAVETSSSPRTFTGALRAVVQVRDRHSQHPSGCDEPTDGCDVDHIVPWATDGVTSQENGRFAVPLPQPYRTPKHQTTPGPRCAG